MRINLLHKALNCSKRNRLNFSERNESWYRQPRSWLIRVTKADVFWIDAEGKSVNVQGQAEVSFHVLFRPGPKSKTSLITLYLVNRIRVAEDSRVDTSHHIFQPQ